MFIRYLNNTRLNAVLKAEQINRFKYVFDCVSRFIIGIWYDDVEDSQHTASQIFMMCLNKGVLSKRISLFLALSFSLLIYFFHSSIKNSTFDAIDSIKAPLITSFPDLVVTLAIVIVLVLGTVAMVTFLWSRSVC